MTILQLSQNHIRTITRQNFEKLSEVKALDISYNKLTSLPGDLFSDLLITYILDISNNLLTSLPDTLFDANNSTQRIEILFLHRNQLVYLPAKAFQGLPRLRSLCLFHNKIQALADDTFADIGVQKIYLFGNNLSILRNASFQNKYVEEIHLYGNALTHLNFTSLIGVANTTKIYIDCQKVKELQQLKVEIVCVTPKFVPTLIMESHLTSVMMREGFTCDLNETAVGIQCSPCRRGTYGEKGKCVRCFRGGFYQDEIGTSVNNDKVVCKKCPDGTYVEEGEGKSVGDCMVCPDGTDKKTHAGYRACFCLDRYSRKDRFGPCEFCLEEGVDCSKSDYKTLKPGYYWSWDFQNANVTAYKLFVKNLQFQNDSFDSNIRYLGEIPRAFACPRNESCKNTAGSVDALCDEGYEGWLCSKCEKNFFSVLNNCLPCPHLEWLFIESSLILCLLVFFSALLFRFYKRQKSRSEHDNRSIIDVLMSRGKIALGFYQVIGEFFTSLHEVNWAKTLTFIGNLISLIELNVLRIFIRPQCFHEKLKVNPKTEFVIGLSFPVAVILLSFVFYWILIARHVCKRRFSAIFQNLTDYKKQLKSNILTITIIILFLTYPPICTIIFQLYPKACDTFCLGKANSTCKVLLRSDYEIECNDLKVYNIMAYIATAGYVIAYPSFLMYLLRKKSRLFLSKTKQGNSLSIQEESEDELQKLIDDSDSNTANPAWMDFLCENYKPQFWYWEIVELTRKVTQTVLLTLLGWEDKMTVLVTIGISVLFMALHARCLPMKSKFEQRLQMFSLVAILVNVLVAAMDVPEKYGDAMSIALIVLNLLVIAIIAAEVVFGLFVRLKHIKVHKMVISSAMSLKNMISSTFNIRVQKDQ